MLYLTDVELIPNKLFEATYLPRAAIHHSIMYQLVKSTRVLFLTKFLTYYSLSNMVSVIETTIHFPPIYYIVL